jgi:WD40 repeat protein
LLTTLNGHSYQVNAVAFSPQGSIVASASDDYTVKLQKPDGTLLTTLRHDNEVWGVAFSPVCLRHACGDATRSPQGFGQTIASASRSKTVKLWKQDGTLLTTLKGHNGGVSGVAFSPDGQTIATGSQDKTVKLWKQDGTLLTTLNGHNGAVWGVAFSPSGKMIASASDDKTVKLWKRDGTLLTTLNGHNGTVWRVAFSPNGKTIASTSDDNTVILWNLDCVLDTDKLVSYACDWVKDYLRTNAQHKQSVSGYSVQEASRFCSGIKPQ